MGGRDVSVVVFGNREKGCLPFFAGRVGFFGERGRDDGQEARLPVDRRKLFYSFFSAPLWREKEEVYSWLGGGTHLDT